MNNLQTDAIKEGLVKLDIRVGFGDILGYGEKQTVSEFPIDTSELVPW